MDCSFQRLTFQRKPENCTRLEDTTVLSETGTPLLTFAFTITTRLTKSDCCTIEISQLHACAAGALKKSSRP